MFHDMLPKETDGRKDTHNDRHGDDRWTKVRQKRHSGDNSKEVTTFYMTNLQAGVTVAVVRESFQSFGKLVDIDIPRRKDKGGSQRY